MGEEEEDVVSGQALTDSQTNTDNIGKLVASCLLLIVGYLFAVNILVDIIQIWKVSHVVHIILTLARLA